MEFTQNKNICPKSGIKIHEPTNNKNIHTGLSRPVNFNSTTMDSLDLDINNYELHDLYTLFNINVKTLLTEESLKTAKQIVLKMHPDKSRLDSKYFLFFSKAYKRLYGIYEFNNKSTNKKLPTDDHEYGDDKKNTLNKLFEANANLKDTKNFNSWFNENFDKHRLENPLDDGHGDWMKSSDGMQDVEDNITKANMNEAFERQKQKMQSLAVYEGVIDSASSFGGSLLDGTGGGSSGGYTDLKQAYTETLIPVSQEDFNKTRKYNSVDEYQRARDTTDTTPLTNQEAQRQLDSNKHYLEQQANALAFKHARDAEKVAKQQNDFWGGLMKITG